MDCPSDLIELASCDASATLDSWEFLNGFVAKYSVEVLGSGKPAYKLRLACEELLSNIIRHVPSTQDGSCLPSSIWLRAYRPATENHRSLVIEIEDNLPPFDPQFEVQRVIDDHQPFEKRPIGGLGLFLVQNSVERVEYQWVNDRNQYRLLALADPPQ